LRWWASKGRGEGGWVGLDFGRPPLIVKADLIKSTVKWGGLEPKGDVATDGSGGIRITINLGNQQHEVTQTIDEDEITDVNTSDSTLEYSG
jgi:hypothetical protein